MFLWLGVRLRLLLAIAAGVRGPISSSALVFVTPVLTLAASFWVLLLVRCDSWYLPLSPVLGAEVCPVISIV